MDSLKFDIVDFDDAYKILPKKNPKHYKENVKIIRATPGHNIIPLPLLAKKTIRMEIIKYGNKLYPTLKSEISDAILLGKVSKKLSIDDEKKIDHILDFYSDISKIISRDLSALKIQNLKK